MSPEQVIALAEQAVYVVIMTAGPLLITALGIGLLVSIFQATTQIQEQTLAFIPKIVGVFVALIIFGPWMLNHVTSFAEQLFNNLHLFVG
ncbi:flagellar biosynthesis protein FliQ [Texcoconibacillus texcoconensis]|uniref:Flagellar biosynthetic protein FliQ n=1 Tax=Texcoconibacillus texcoconensis TaxID=1095777 RepID=A0A840QKS8_9BACI|nr:flagellar biosynthesis protein FliQ [Texcoconibacillus texcoconensis]MBB5172063.1 flagellar biosynthetic protein FliQ [Texcoconibacillus texcoconensis]